MNELPNHVPTQTSQPSPSTNANLCGSTGLPFGDGCTAAPIFWKDCNATGWCEAHLANHIDSYAHRLDGLPKRIFSTHPDGSSSTTTPRTTPEQLRQDALPPWRHPNFQLTPTSTPVQSTYQTHVAANAADGADYIRRLLWEYIQTGSTRRLPPEVEVQSTKPPQDKQKTEQRQFGHINPELLQVHDPDPIEYVERTEFRKEWEACPVQFAPTITALPPPSPEEASTDAVTRGQKRKQEEEGIVREGSGKNDDFNFTEYLNDLDMEADGEQSDEDRSEEGEVRKKGKVMAEEGKEDKGQGKGMEQEEDTDVDNEYDPHNDDDTINEPNII